MVESGRPVTVQVIADGSDSNSTDRRRWRTRRSLMAERAAELAMARPPAPARRRRVASRRASASGSIPQLLSQHFMVPGVLALLLMVITAVLGSMAIVREKELGTLEQLNVTPLRRWELTVGKLLPFGLIGIIDVFLVVGVAVLLVRDPAARQLRAAVRPVARLPAVHARPRAVRVDHVAARSSRP